MVVDIDDHRPHLTINCIDTVHILPVGVLEDVIKGDKCFTDIEGWQDLIKPILKDYLESLTPKTK